MIIFHASGRAACCKLTEPITSGSVGMPVEFQFDEAWDGLAKTAVFTGSGVSVDQVIGADNALVVPWECLADEGGTLIIGVTGTRNSGEIVIPTVLARAGVIVKGAALSGVGPHDPTPSWAVQVQEEAAEALEKATAVEEAAERGDFDGQDGAPGRDGQDGRDGTDGQDGVSPEVTIAEITGGHSVTITDAEHPSGQSFDVMDGQDGGGVPFGGTTGQVLKKASGTDYDTEWANESTEIFQMHSGTTFAAAKAAFDAGKLVVYKVEPVSGDAYIYLAVRATASGITFESWWYMTEDMIPIRSQVVMDSSGTFGTPEYTYLASLDAPEFQGIPTAPTATAGDNSAKLATTAFVEGEISGKAASDLGVSGASVGQYVKIKTVDGSGKPTSFEPGTPSGGGGTTDYTALSNKPSINSVTLTGDKSASDLSLASAVDVTALQNVNSLNGLAVPIPMTDGYYIKLNGATANVNEPTAQGSAPTRYGVVACVAGDVFTVNAQGGSSPRAWGFVASDGTVLSVASAGATVTDLILTAPTNAAYFVVNDLSFTKTSYVGTIVKDDFAALSAASVMVRRRLSNPDNLNSITLPGIYLCSAGSSAAPLNAPTTTEAGMLIVYNYDTITEQHWRSEHFAYTRAGKSGVWGAWERADFASRIRLSSSDDMDNVTQSGIYDYATASIPAHAPYPQGGVVTVYALPITSGLTAQTYYGQGCFAARIKISTGWTNWGLIAYDAESITELPVLELTGDTSTMSKDNAVTLDYSLFGATGTCSCKWQGSSSQRYPKKNYTINFSSGFDGWYQWATFVNALRQTNGNISRVDTTSRWGTQTKYCFKANWVDPSAIRNIVCARLWGQIVKSRVTAGDVDDGRADAPNYGAIDGFPCEIKINGQSAGLYTLNIPKGAWQFAFGSGAAEYLVSGEDNASQACRWKALAELDGTDFSVEYATSGVEDTAIKASLNAAIQAAINAGSDWETTLAPYVDIDSVFDYFIFTCCVNNHDALARNILYGTYDGTRWFMSAYDLDTTFGVDPYGTMWFPVVNDRNQFAEAASIHRLCYLAYTYSKPKLAARYAALRAGILSEENVWKELSNFAVDIPTRDYNLDRNLWTNAPGTSTADMAQYMDYYRMHCAYLDEELLGPPYPVTSVNGQTGAVVLNASDVGALPASTKYAASQSAGGAADKAVSIPMGTVDSTSTSTAFTATVSGITELRDGVCVWLTNGVVTSAAGCTLDINSLGAKPIYNSIAAATATTTAFNINYTMLFIYNSSRVTGGCWDIVYGYDSNTTYTLPKLGCGYTTCSTAAATAAKTASLSSYALTTGGYLIVKFTNAVGAGATLNVNSKGAKALYYQGAAITDGVIKAGDTVLLCYSTQYHVVAIDRWGAEAVPNVVTQSAPTAITLADNTEYYLTNVGSLTLTYPSATHWECWLKLTTASSGTVTVTLPTSTYIGSAPTFGNSETWEISIRDGVVVAGKAASA